MPTTPRRALSPFLFSALLALVSPFAAALDLLEDPFDARGAVGASSAKSKSFPREADPCLASKKIDAAWTLLDVIDQALCHNPQTRQAWANARLQAAQVGVSQAAYLPSVTVSGTANRNFNPGTSTGANIQSPVQERFTPSIAFNYLLFDFGGRAGNLENAREALEVANWSHSSTLQNVMFSAVQAYYQLFAAQSSVDAAQESVVSNSKALDAARVRHQVGAAALADVLQAQTSHSQAKLTLQQADGNARNALGTLANVMGFMPDGGLRIVAPVFEGPDAQKEEDVHRLIEEARLLRPDLAAAEAKIRADQASVKSARSAGLPTVNMVGSYGYNFSSVYNQTHNWSVGFQFSVPLFTGFSNTYQIHAAEQQVAVDEAARDQLEQSIGLAVWTALNNLNTARETVHNSDDLLASADQNEKVALGRYQAGAGNIIDLLNAEASLANARFQRVQSRFNWSIAKAQLAQAMGRIDPAELGEITGTASIRKVAD